jgi:hypothetical protein
MMSGRITLPGGATAIGEGFAVIRQPLLDLAGGLSDESLQEASGMGSVFCAQDFHVNPARGPVDHHEQIAMRRFIRHLRQILDIDMDATRLIILKGVLWLIVGFWLGSQRLEMGDALPAQAAIQTETGDCGIEELARHRQPVIQGQEQGLAQLNDDQHLGWC